MHKYFFFLIALLRRRIVVAEAPGVGGALCIGVVGGRQLRSGRDAQVVEDRVGDRLKSVRRAGEQRDWRL